MPCYTGGATVGSGAETVQDGEDGIAGDSGKCRHVSKKCAMKPIAFCRPTLVRRIECI